MEDPVRTHIRNQCFYGRGIDKITFQYFDVFQQVFNILNPAPPSSNSVNFHSRMMLQNILRKMTRESCNSSN
jgi:hypothetical protein